MGRTAVRRKIYGVTRGTLKLPDTSDLASATVCELLASVTAIAALNPAVRIQTSPELKFHDDPDRARDGPWTIGGSAEDAAIEHGIFLAS